MYCPCFLSQSIEGPTFPDLTWTLPDVGYGPQDLPHTLFTCSTIEKVTTLCHWLITELRDHLHVRDGNDHRIEEVEHLVLLFHLLIDDGD